MMFADAYALLSHRMTRTQDSQEVKALKLVLLKCQRFDHLNHFIQKSEDDFSQLAVKWDNLQKGI